MHIATTNKYNFFKTYIGLISDCMILFINIIFSTLLYIKLLPILFNSPVQIHIPSIHISLQF